MLLEPVTQERKGVGIELLHPGSWFHSAPPLKLAVRHPVIPFLRSRPSSVAPYFSNEFAIPRVRVEASPGFE